MISPVDQILTDIPELRHHLEKYAWNRDRYPRNWKILDTHADVYLLALEQYSQRTGTRTGVWSTGASSIAIVSENRGRFRLRHAEDFEYDTLWGVLNIDTSHAVMVRIEEYDNTIDERYGSDDIYLVDYDQHRPQALAPYGFGIGSYHAGDLKLALNRTRNWIAFARDERVGWQTDSHIVICVYDLADSQLLLKAELPGITSINSIELPGSADFLIVTDRERRDHAYAITGEGLKELKRLPRTQRWQVSLSFAGEDRQLAERLAIGFRDKGISVFYDHFEQSNLLGKDLYQYLFEVYSKHSQYCIILISENYRKRSWTMHELKAMQSASLTSDHEYILPVRLDDTELPGLPPQIAYLDYRRESVESIVEIVTAKLRS